MPTSHLKSLESSLYTFVTRDGKKSEGLLLRAKIGEQTGYACVHSWPHLGDPNFDELLLNLKTKNFDHPLLARAAENIDLDLTARSQNKALLGNIKLKSHLQIKSEAELNAESLQILRAQDFKTLKLKVSKNYSEVLENLKTIEPHLGDIKLRLDFNSQLSAATFKTFLKSLGQNLLDSIDFIEDPFALSEEWEQIQKEFKVRLALDFQKPQARDPRFLESFDVLILKPAYDDLAFWIQYALLNMKRVVFTSYMQHPVGQAFDLHYAQKYFTEHPLLCDEVGFLNIEAQPFDETYPFLNSQCPDITLNSSASGVGFSQALETETWLKLW